jgi:hypothetical protein
MRCVLFLTVVFIVTAIIPSSYAQGSIETPEVYDELGEIDIGNKGYFELQLFYWKPDGFDKILTQAHVDMIICSLIGDNKEIKPIRTYGTDGGRLDYGEEVPVKGDFYNMNLMWRPLGHPVSLEIIKRGLGFSSYRTKFKGPALYKIPYKTREVFLTYRVLIPKYKSTEEWSTGREYYYTEPQTVRWTLVWPEE